MIKKQDKASWERPKWKASPSVDRCGARVSMHVDIGHAAANFSMPAKMAIAFARSVIEQAEWGLERE